ncbi:polysaccharide deacetylase [Candidatus Magnetobacterium bavaricum]|uniref:Polysaccharide deacetylase n=1 Tax=Candidatus Magnetobacterium bavaricum TaxID=29290 RepID=A0A0F3GTN7_9BACT|nr:polysaccharide deacetylase [Candidatus Magnetobacterium bavaricum]
MNRSGLFGFFGTVLLLLVFFALPVLSYAQDKSGGLVLSFDDGYPSWITVVADKLASVGGKATGFVNNHRLQGGKLSYGDVLTLQNKYGWEIGTHTYHHHNAPQYVKKNGLADWVSKELDASIKDLESHGLKTKSIVFPYNEFTPELKTEALKKLQSLRSRDILPLAKGLREDKTFPGSALDMSQYTPLDLIFRMIDMASDKGEYLFLYGHEILPDEQFITGIVESVSQHSITTSEAVPSALNGVTFCMIPDSRVRYHGPSIKVVSINDKTINVSANGLPGLTKPGAPFLIGPCYGMRISDFNKMIDYAATKLKFYTAHEIVSMNDNKTTQTNTKE